MYCRRIEHTYEGSTNDVDIKIKVRHLPTKMFCINSTLGFLHVHSFTVTRIQQVLIIWRLHFTFLGHN